MRIGTVIRRERRSYDPIPRPQRHSRTPDQRRPQRPRKVERVR